MNIGIFASGEGSTLQAVIDACKSNNIVGQVTVVICNKKEANALYRAQASGISTVHISKETHPDPNDRDVAMLNRLINHNVELVFLAGYLKKIGPKTLQQYQGRIINTHPALLPKYGGKGMYGINVYKAVLVARETETVHIADDEYDTGPVIAQCRVSVEPGNTAETLAERVHKRELTFIIDTLSKITSGKLKL